MTDRAPYGTDTETDGEFEDARESLGGGVSPAVGPRSSFASTTYTRSTSMHDFVSVRSAPSAGHGDEEEDEREVLADGRDEFRRTIRGGRPSSVAAVQPQKPETAELQVQTEEMQPQIIEKVKTVYVDKIVHVDRPVVVEKIVYRERPSTAPSTSSPTSNADALDESAATASAFLDDRAPVTRPTTPSNDLFASTRTVKAGLPPIDTKGKARESFATMAPPPVPSTTTRKAGSPRKSGASTMSNKSTLAPPRPTSPPPPDLLFRAQSPTFDDDYARRSSFLAPPGATTLRSQPSSLTASPSSSRFAGPFSNLKNVRPQASMDTSVSQTKRRSSTRHAHSSSARSVSELSVRSDVSRRMSMASEATSDGGFEPTEHQPNMRGPADSTDPAVIHAITQTMIGEFMFKYTRKKLGGGMSENRHKRFFWVHPYTKALYWSSADPGAQNTTYSNAKSGMSNSLLSFSNRSTNELSNLSFHRRCSTSSRSQPLPCWTQPEQYYRSNSRSRDEIHCWYERTT